MKLTDYLEQFYPSTRKDKTYNYSAFARDNDLTAQNVKGYADNPKSVIVYVEGELCLVAHRRPLIVNKEQSK